MGKKTFESSMKKLEQIVQEMESGDLPLEKSLTKFEEGVKLSKFCSDKLDEVEKKITMLMKDNQGNMMERPFLGEESSDV